MLPEKGQIPDRGTDAVRVVQVTVHADAIPSGVSAFKTVALAKRQPVGLIHHSI